MNKPMLVLFTIFSLLLLVSLGCLDPTPKDRIMDMISSKGYEGEVFMGENAIIITINADNEYKLVDNMKEIGEFAETISSKLIRVEGYLDNKPFISLTFNGDNITFEDIRGPEERIRDDISAFEFFGTVKVNDDIYFYGEYYGNESEFFDELLSAAFDGFEYAPWANKAVFTVGPFIYTIKKEDLFDYMEGKLSEDEFISLIDIAENDEYPSIKINLNATGSKSNASQGSCSDADYAYRMYVKYYNKVTDMMSRRNNGEDVNESELNESYEKFKYWRSCYMNDTADESSEIEEES